METRLLMTLVTEAGLVVMACLLVLGVRALRAALRDHKKVADSALPAAGDLAQVLSVDPTRVVVRRNGRRVVLPARPGHVDDVDGLVCGAEVVVLSIEHPRIAVVAPFECGIEAIRGGDV